jgi:hypothetical protein
MMLDDKCSSLVTGALRQMAVSSVKENGIRNVTGFLGATGKQRI